MCVLFDVIISVVRVLQTSGVASKDGRRSDAISVLALSADVDAVVVVVYKNIEILKSICADDLLQHSFQVFIRPLLPSLLLPPHPLRQRCSRSNGQAVG